MKLKYLLQVIVAVTFLTAGTVLQSRAQTKLIKSDAATETPTPYDFTKNKEYHKHFTKHSFYLEMRDDVQLAVDLYLPQVVKEGQKVPTILYQTRYWRSVQFRWPFKWFMNMVPSTSNFPVLEFVKNGYALVCVDVRGTGASFGNKIHSLPDASEIKDGNEVVNWIVKQPWSDGQVGACGISYIGNTALYLLINRNPAVKAIAPMYSIFDLYDDIALPNGILFSNFIKEWNQFCEGLDNNYVSGSRSGFLLRLAVKGVGRVDGESRKEYKAAIAFHDCNVYMNNKGYSPEYMDDERTRNGQIRIPDLKSPHLYIDTINKSGAAIYSYSGWWDAAVHAAVKQYINFTNPGNKLIIGPWNHGGIWDISPYGHQRSEFDHIGEVMKFFDYHLKGKDTGISREAKVNYYTMGAEEWRSSDTWPPENSVYHNFYFAPENTLSENPTYSTTNYDSYRVDTSLGSGSVSRWNFGSLSAIKSGAPNRSKEDSSMLTYTTQTLVSDIEVTGHPLITLYLSANVEDAGVFVYLEDVDQNGKSIRVTDGQMRIACRKTYDKPVYYKDVVPYHSYKREDAQILKPGEVAEVKFDLYPTSYLFKKGHSIRLSIAGVDKDYFDTITPYNTEFHIYRSRNYPSGIELPVIEDQSSQSLAR